MDRTVFRDWFNKEKVPNWRCPTCGIGALNLKPDSLLYFEGSDSSSMRDHPAWGVEMIDYRATCMFICARQTCKEIVACVATGDVEHHREFDDLTGEETETYEESFFPKLFIPPLVMIDFPKECPQSVRNRLMQSFALFFADPGAAMNAARAAVETLLTELGVARYVVKIAKRHRIPLHARIERLPPKHAATKETLLAIKWLGNAGSHDGSEPLSHEHVCTMYDMLEHCLAEIYDDKAQKLKAVVKQVNLRKGLWSPYGS